MSHELSLEDLSGQELDELLNDMFYAVLYWYDSYRGQGDWWSVKTGLDLDHNLVAFANDMYKEC